MNTAGVDAAQRRSRPPSTARPCASCLVHQTKPAGVALCGCCLCKGFGEFCQVVLAWKVESGNPANPSHSRVVHRRGYTETPPGHDGGAWCELTWSVHYSPCREQETGAITASPSGARVFFCVVMRVQNIVNRFNAPEPSTQKRLKG